MPSGLRARLGGRPLRGAAVSVALHLLVVVVLIGFGTPVGERYRVKRGEPLFVELPELPEPAPAGNPAAKTPGATASAPAPPPTPPAARPQLARPAPRPAAPPAVASRPSPRPPAARPAPPAPQPPPSDMGSLPAPQPKAAPAAETPATPQTSPPAAAAPPAPTGPQVAAVPPQRETPPVDIRSALRPGTGAGGSGGGRGGIEGEPIPLDSRDPKFSDYLDRVRRMIKERWGYPCVKNAASQECEYKSAQLVIEFGIAKDGQVPFVNVRRSSGWAIYDDYAVNAIKLASPFPPVPDALSKKGIPILATFNYVVDSSLTNLLR